MPIMQKSSVQTKIEINKRWHAVRRLIPIADLAILWPPRRPHRTTARAQELESSHVAGCVYLYDDYMYTHLLTPNVRLKYLPIPEGECWNNWRISAFHFLSVFSSYFILTAFDQTGRQLGDSVYSTSFSSHYFPHLVNSLMQKKCTPLLRHMRQLL